MPAESEKPTDQLKEAQTPPPEKTEAELAPAVEFVSRYLGKPAEDDGKESEKPKKQDDAPPGDEPAGDDPPKRKPKKVVDRREEDRQVIDEEKLGRAIGETIAKSTAAAKEAEKPKVEDKPAADTPESRKLRVLAQLEENHPDRYKGIQERYKNNLTKFKEYAKKWQDENPGETFNQDDDEHEEFRDKLWNEAKYDDDDFHMAVVDLRLKERERAATEQKKDDPETAAMRAKLEEMERKEKLRENQQEIAKSSAEAGNAFWKNMGKEFEGVVTETGAISRKALGDIKERDEDEHAIVVQSAAIVEQLSAAIQCLDQRLVKYDETNQAHQVLSQFIRDQGEAMMKLPEKDRLSDDGKKVFVSDDVYSKMSAKEREGAWTFTTKDIQIRLAKTYAKNAMKKIEHDREWFQKRAKRAGLIKEDDTQSLISAKSEHPMHNAMRAARELQSRAIEDDEKPRSPTVPTVPRMAPKKSGEDETPKNATEAFVLRSIRGS